MRSFLAGGQLLMRGRWELVQTPMDGLDGVVIEGG